jgi:hypothetical protein
MRGRWATGGAQSGVQLRLVYDFLSCVIQLPHDEQLGTKGGSA